MCCLEGADPPDPNARAEPVIFKKVDLTVLPEQSKETLLQKVP
jgi:hypothetical protein